MLTLSFAKFSFFHVRWLIVVNISFVIWFVVVFTYFISLMQFFILCVHYTPDPSPGPCLQLQTIFYFNNSIISIYCKSVYVISSIISSIAYPILRSVDLLFKPCWLSIHDLTTPYFTVHHHTYMYWLGAESQERQYNTEPGSHVESAEGMGCKFSKRKFGRVGVIDTFKSAHYQPLISSKFVRKFKNRRKESKKSEKETAVKFSDFSTTSATYIKSASETSKITVRLSCDGSTLEIEQCEMTCEEDIDINEGCATSEKVVRSFSVPILSSFTHCAITKLKFESMGLESVRNTGVDDSFKSVPIASFESLQTTSFEESSESVHNATLLTSEKHAQTGHAIGSVRSDLNENSEFVGYDSEFQNYMLPTSESAWFSEMEYFVSDLPRKRTYEKAHIDIHNVPELQTDVIDIIDSVEEQTPGYDSNIIRFPIELDPDYSIHQCRTELSQNNSDQMTENHIDGENNLTFIAVNNQNKNSLSKPGKHSLHGENEADIKFSQYRQSKEDESILSLNQGIKTKQYCLSVRNGTSDCLQKHIKTSHNKNAEALSYSNGFSELTTLNQNSDNQHGMFTHNSVNLQQSHGITETDCHDQQACCSQPSNHLSRTEPESQYTQPKELSHHRRCDFPSCTRSRRAVVQHEGETCFCDDADGSVPFCKRCTGSDQHNRKNFQRSRFQKQNCKLQTFQVDPTWHPDFNDTCADRHFNTLTSESHEKLDFGILTSTNEASSPNSRQNYTDLRNMECENSTIECLCRHDKNYAQCSPEWHLHSEYDRQFMVEPSRGITIEENLCGPQCDPQTEIYCHRHNNSSVDHSHRCIFHSARFNNQFLSSPDNVNNERKDIRKDEHKLPLLFPSYQSYFINSVDQTDMGPPGRFTTSDNGCPMSHRGHDTDSSSTNLQTSHNILSLYDNCDTEWGLNTDSFDYTNGNISESELNSNCQNKLELNEKNLESKCEDNGDSEIRLNNTLCLVDYTICPIVDSTTYRDNNISTSGPQECFTSNNGPIERMKDTCSAHCNNNYDSFTSNSSSNSSVDTIN